MNLWSFLSSLMPALLQLAQDLFRRHRGNVEAAKAEIKRIQDYGRRFETAESALRAELEELASEDTRREKLPKE